MNIFKVFDVTGMVAIPPQEFQTQCFQRKIVIVGRNSPKFGIRPFTSYPLSVMFLSQKIV